MQYFTEINGRIHAILNYALRQSNDDEIISEPLDTRELAIYRNLKGAGQNDPEIFKTLFPPSIPKINRRPPSKVEIEIEQLNKRQLIHLILQEVKTSIVSLSRMSVTDLRKLLLSLRAKR